MKLEIKHLAPYLPYGLKGQVKDYPKINNPEVWDNETLESIDVIDKTLSFSNAMDVYLENPEEGSFKPILRPLSELDVESDSPFITPEYLIDCSYCYVQMLFSRHYDVFGLIDKGLAININDINPVEA